MRKQERLEVERIRKQELQQMSDELFQRFKGMNPQPPARVNQETGDPDPNMFPKENQDRLSHSAADRDEQQRVQQSVCSGVLQCPAEGFSKQRQGECR